MNIKDNQKSLMNIKDYIKSLMNIKDNQKSLKKIKDYTKCRLWYRLNIDDITEYQRFSKEKTYLFWILMILLNIDLITLNINIIYWILMIL